MMRVLAILAGVLAITSALPYPYPYPDPEPYPNPNPYPEALPYPNPYPGPEPYPNPYPYPKALPYPNPYPEATPEVANPNPVALHYPDRNNNPYLYSGYNQRPLKAHAGNTQFSTNPGTMFLERNYANTRTPGLSGGSPMGNAGSTTQGMMRGSGSFGSSNKAGVGYVKREAPDYPGLSDLDHAILKREATNFPSQPQPQRPYVGYNYPGYGSGTGGNADMGGYSFGMDGAYQGKNSVLSDMYEGTRSSSSTQGYHTGAGTSGSRVSSSSHG